MQTLTWVLLWVVAGLSVTGCGAGDTPCESVVTMRAVESMPVGDDTSATWLFRVTLAYADGRTSSEEVTCMANRFSDAGEFFCDHVLVLQRGALSALRIEQLRRTDAMVEQILATHQPDLAASLVTSDATRQCYVYDVRIEAEAL